MAVPSLLGQTSRICPVGLPSPAGSEFFTRACYFREWSTPQRQPGDLVGSGESVASEGRRRGGLGAQAAAYLPAAVALAVIAVAGLFAERQSRALAELTERDAVRGRVEAPGRRPGAGHRLGRRAGGPARGPLAVATAGRARRRPRRHGRARGPGVGARARVARRMRPRGPGRPRSRAGGSAGGRAGARPHGAARRRLDAGGGARRRLERPARPRPGRSGC